MLLLLPLLVIAGIAIYVMKPEERLRLLRLGQAAVRQAADSAIQYHRERDPFREALDARTPWPVVTLALVALNAGVFIGMLFGAGAMADPATLVAWGGNLGPLTSNGEWWRLVTAMFVHSGFWHLVVNIAGLVPLGIMLERLVGHFAFAALYLAAGVFASVVSLFAFPLDVSVGASGAIFGVYGLLVASIVWGLIERSPLTIRLAALKPLAPAAAVFMLYSVATSRGNGAELAGLLTGLVCGLVLARGMSERKPPAVRIAAAAAVALAIAAVLAVPLRGMCDARPEMARVIAFEDRTARVYQTAVNQFRLGAISAEALARIIERTIVPDLQEVLTRVTALKRVPPVQEALVMSAEAYLRLRDQSWRLRAEGLHKSSMQTLRKADDTEHDSLEAFEQLKAGSSAEVAEGL
jgi:membrane associated rhomboid family serine protease